VYPETVCLSREKQSSMEVGFSLHCRTDTKPDAGSAASLGGKPDQLTVTNWSMKSPTNNPLEGETVTFDGTLGAGLRFAATASTPAPGWSRLRMVKAPKKSAEGARQSHLLPHDDRCIHRR
jgi:hypothetical protein